jgi:hypothetical protein
LDFFMKMDWSGPVIRITSQLPGASLKMISGRPTTVTVKDESYIKRRWYLTLIWVVVSSRQDVVSPGRWTHGMG